MNNDTRGNCPKLGWALVKNDLLDLTIGFRMTDSLLPEEVRHVWRSSVKCLGFLRVFFVPFEFSFENACYAGYNMI